MIRTHRPTGHHWTCASHFQQSKQYRNLDAHDWDAPSAKTLVADPDDNLPTSSRVAKRRRVEQLANDFLEGQTLFISSACANGPDLTRTVDKVLCEKGLTWNEVLDDYDGDLWADGEDGWSALRQRSKARAAKKTSRSQSKGPRRSMRAQEDTALNDIEAVQSDNSRTATRLPHKISTAPSDEALTRAAELRARKGLLLANSAEHLGSVMRSKGQATQSAPPTARATSSFKQCSSSRPLNPNTPAETTMADELRLSRTDSPSRRPRAFTVPVESFSSETTVEDMPMPTLESEPIATGSTAMELCTALGDIHSSHKVDPPGKSGLTIHNDLFPNTGRSHSTWNAINDGQQHPLAMSTSESAKTSRTRSSRKSTSQDPRSASQENTKETSASSGKPSQPMSQSRLTSSFKAAKSDFITVEKSQNGSTPFTYRKRTKAGKDVIPAAGLTPSDDVGPQQSTQPDPSGHQTLEPCRPTAAPSASAAPPTFDISSMQDSSHAPALSMALVDEHMNRKLPNSPRSARRSSSVKKALRSEMRLSGAELSRAPDALSSSQPHESLYQSLMPQDEDGRPSHGTSCDSRGNRRSMGQWPGTQVLLSRAQHDLFMSPDKLSFVPAIPQSEPHQIHADSSEIQHVGETREPLRQLSQEHLPGTQALMDNWSPWSTAKKAKPGKRASFVPSPLVSKNMVTPNVRPTRSLKSGLKPPVDSERVCETQPRRRSLRFSTITAETPVPKRRTTTDTTLPVTTSHSTEVSIHSPGTNHHLSQSFYGPARSGVSPSINLDFTTISFAATAAQPINDIDGSMADWESHDKISGFQNAQRESEDPLPETVLADVATEFLSTADFDGVVGKV